MLSVFQIFGLNFLFWTCVGVARFFSETLERLEKPDLPSPRMFFAGALAGTALTGAMFAFLIHVLGLTPALTMSATRDEALTVTLLWVLCAGVGGYAAARILGHRTHQAGALVGAGAALGGIALFATHTGTLGTPTFGIAMVLFLQASLPSAMMGSEAGRMMNARLGRIDRRRLLASPDVRVHPEDVAVLIAAHNEALTIASTVESVLQVTSADHIYIASDGSKDETVAIARGMGCIVEDIQPNRGKARALTYMMATHDLCNRYKAVMIMDADLKIAPDYFARMLPNFDDPQTAAAVSRAVPHWPEHRFPRWHLLVTAYRAQLWRVLQFTIRYGQTWRYMNVTPIIPGGSSIYRTRVLSQIEIDVPGLIIEDFNMTFEVHHKRLGKIAYSPSAIVIDQEPYSIRDFTKQIRRWYLGFWQTAIRHGPWASFFWVTMALFAIELGLASVASILLPVIIVTWIIEAAYPAAAAFSPFAEPSVLLIAFLSILIIDYLVTIFIAALDKRPLMLIYAFGFLPLRIIEAGVFLYTLPLAFRTRSDGQWKSPERVSYRDTSAATAASALTRQ